MSLLVLTEAIAWKIANYQLQINLHTNKLDNKLDFWYVERCVMSDNKYN